MLDHKKLDTDEMCMLSCISHSCRKKLCRLNNILICEKKRDFFFECNLNALVYSLISACRAVTGSGIDKFELSLPENQIYISLSPNTINWCILNVISNYLLYSKNGKIKIKLKPLSDGVIISIDGNCSLALDDIKFFSDIKYSGFSTIKHAVELHKGKLFYLKDKERLTVNIFLPYSMNASKQYFPPDFIDLICDKLSPIYTALCDCCLYHF